MRGSGPLARMIAADVGVIDETRHRGDESHDSSEEHRVERIADEIHLGSKNETREIEQETQKEKTDREMDKHRMERMPERFAFEIVLYHVDITPVEDSRPRPRRFCAIYLSTFVRR